MLIKNSIAVVIQLQPGDKKRSSLYSANKISRGGATLPFFSPWITYPFAVNFRRKRRRVALKIFQFPIFSRSSRLTTRIIERVKSGIEGGGPRGKGRETLFRNRLSRTKGMTPALCFECAPRASVATLPRFIGFQWASLVVSIEGCTFDAVFPRTEETGCDKMENSNSIVAQTCKIIRHSLSWSRGSIRAANYTLLSRDIGQILRRRESERERGGEARTRSSRIPRRRIDFHGRRLMMVGACTG